MHDDSTDQRRKRTATDNLLRRRLRVAGYQATDRSAKGYLVIRMPDRIFNY